MNHSTTLFIIFSIFLIVSVSMAGCSDSSDSSASGSATDTVAAATTAGPLYSSGDVVRSATGSESPAWLVVSYDSATDSYKKALIYKNADGSYGYRTGSSADTLKRAGMEKVYTVKIAHVTAESVPTAAPKTATTVVTAATTGAATTTGATTTAATTTTTASAAKPVVKKIDPEQGEAGTSVSTDITGGDFISNLTIKLRRSGETSITARDVTWYSATSVSGIFDLPNTTKAGSWDIVITNPNGQSGELTNYFMVQGNGTVK
jgi:hypothetical protein